MTAQHTPSFTPGPWKADAPTRRVPAWQIVTAHGFPAYVGSASHNEQSEANARLIAAAPDLLVVLRDCADALDQYSTLPADKAKQLRKAARAAISKAEGTQ